MKRMFYPVLLVFLAPVAAAGCGGGSRPPATVSPEAATASPSDGADDQPPGTLTCGDLKTAVTAATLMHPGVVASIVRSSSTADAPVADAAQRLATAYATAVAAHGTSDEPDAVAAVSMAAADMTKICDESGLNAVG